MLEKVIDLEREFEDYFLDNPLHSYRQFKDFIRDNYHGVIIKNLDKEVDRVRKKLQRSGLLVATRENDSTGKFMSKKVILK